MALKYLVTLAQEERDGLEQLLAKGKAAARKLTHARILLQADAGERGPAWKDEDIVNALDCGTATVSRVRERFVMEGFAAALEPKRPERVYERRLAGKGEAQLVTIACSQPPDGRTRWTMRLLADRLVDLGVVDRISSATVRLTLKNTNSSRGCRSKGSSPRAKMPNSWLPWRTCWRSTSGRPTRCARWSASMNCTPS